MPRIVSPGVRLVPALAALCLAVAACADGTTVPTRSPGAPRAEASPTSAFPDYGSVRVCNYYHTNGVSGAGTYVATVDGVAGAPFTLGADGECAVAWQTTGDGSHTINITQIGPNCTLNLAVRHLVNGGNYEIIFDGPASSYDVTVTTAGGNSSDGYALWFQNDGSGGCTPPPPPPPSCPAVSISSNFNGTAVAAGNFIWFNAVFKPSGVTSAGGTLNFGNGVVTFTSNGTNYVVNVPPSIVTFSPSATKATTTFNGTTWLTTVPWNYTGNIFLGGAAFVVPAGGLPGGTNPVKWSESMTTNVSGLKLNWQWAAAVYKSFSSDLSLLGVKPVDSNSLSNYLNSDHAGTPESFKSYVTGGARGGGGSNFTGSYSGTGSSTPCPTP